MSRSTTTSRRLKAVALLGAGAAAGIIGAASIAANAQTTSTSASSSTSTSSTGSTASTAGIPAGRHGGGAGEIAITGTKAATLKAATLKQVPGATVDEISTDSGDAAYEVHLTKADGTDVTAKFDKNLAFVNVEAGRGK